MKECLARSSKHQKISSVEDMERAKQIQANLSPEHPSFIKPMVKSYWEQPFRLMLPSEFCGKHIPRGDKMVVFEVESGQSYEVKLLGAKRLFDSGWKKFSEDELLLKRDVLVFHMVEPCRFKVYIVRASGVAPIVRSALVDKVDDSATAREKAERKTEIESGNKRQELVQGDVTNNNISNVEGVLPSDTVSNFEDFEVVVDDTLITFPKQVMVEYLDLCKSQNALLHSQLIKGVQGKLAAEMIFKTVHIAKAIRESKLYTPRDLIKSWWTTLASFEELGMYVGFIKMRVTRLLKLQKHAKRAKDDEIVREHVKKYEEEATAPW